MTRLYRILRFIDEFLKEFKPDVTVTEHRVNNSEYLSIRIHIREPNSLIVIREYHFKGKLVAYGYYMRIKSYEEWWDNRPHHPEVSSYPDHRHVSGKILELTSPTLEKFFKKARKILIEAR